MILISCVERADVIATTLDVIAAAVTAIITIKVIRVGTFVEIYISTTTAIAAEKVAAVV